MTNYESVKKRRRLLKQKAVLFLGGKCSICGYNKCLAALDFHHINPNEKEFIITGRIRSWNKIENELKKCVLVCSNCHREIHNPDKELDLTLKDRQALYYSYKCEHCGKEFTTKDTNRKYCSVKCRADHSRKVARPSCEQLVNEVKESSFVQVGKKYGVTDNAIRKWLKDYGINPKEIK